MSDTTNRLRQTILIIGAGPAGLFAAYKLASETDQSQVRIVVCDKGRGLQQRICSVREGKPCSNCAPCNITHGFGGAGTFSDCKLSLSPFGVGGVIDEYIGPSKALAYVQSVEQIFNKFDVNAKERFTYGLMDMLYSDINRRLSAAGLELTYNPTKHIGTDGTYLVMNELYRSLWDMGVEFFFNYDCQGIELRDRASENDFAYKASFSVLGRRDRYQKIMADSIIIAPGRSGNTWLVNLMKKLNVNTHPNHFDLGFRVETPNEIVEEIANKLYDAKISCTYNDMKVRTFCMNPSGYVSEEHYDDGSVLANGHSYADQKSDNTNFVILVSMELDVETQIIRNYIQDYSKQNNGKLVIANVFNDKDGIVTEPTLTTAVPGDLIPPVVSSGVRGDYDIPMAYPTWARMAYTGVLTLIEKLDKVCPGIYSEKTNLYGLEAKFYSDIIEVDNEFQTTLPGVYCIGDGSGITRGICQSAASGLVVADSIMKGLK